MDEDRESEIITRKTMSVGTESDMLISSSDDDPDKFNIAHKNYNTIVSVIRQTENPVSR